MVLIAAMIFIQIGAALAKGLFPTVGAVGAVTLRLVLAAIMLVAAWRPWRMRPTRGEVRTIVMYGLAMGWMNFFFYSALRTIPLGLAVALEFAGPLALAMLSSRRAIDFLWIALAVTGLFALLSHGIRSAPLAPRGVGFALAAGFCWALYILFGQKAAVAQGGQIAALGVLVAAIVIAPIGIVQVGIRLWSPAIWPAALGVALLSSALPYSMEILALARLPARTFGVLMSLEPALAAVSGWCFLGERLTWLQWVAIACIMLASSGSAFTSQSADKSYRQI